MILPLTPLSKTITGLPPGTHWFSLAAVNAEDVRSEFVTNYKTILPTDFKTTSTKVYYIARQANRYLFIEVGTVPLGVVCDYTQPMGPYYLVPRESVSSWIGTVHPAAVVASCG
jgi:hypothetical protein